MLIVIDWLWPWLHSFGKIKHCYKVPFTAKPSFRKNRTYEDHFTTKSGSLYTEIKLTTKKAGRRGNMHGAKSSAEGKGLPGPEGNSLV